MHAQVLKAFGGPDHLELRDIPKPEVRPGTVLIRIAAASINPIDAKIMSGLPSGLPIGPDLPAVLGADLAGTVEEVGAGVLDFRSGDEVYGCAGGVKGLGGTLAEYIVADARLLAPKPSTLSLHEAAALPLVTITAWEGLERGEILASRAK